MPVLTRAHLIELLYARVGLSRTESSELLESVLASLTAALENGEHVKISGFGIFSVRKKRSRVGRNPKTGIEVEIAPRSVVIFRASCVLKARVNGQIETEDDL